MKNGAWKNKNSGMTLVELLVAMVVGLILLGGVYVSFVSSTTTNSMNEQLSRMQENGRFAIEVLSREIRSAGYSGCNSFVTVENNHKDPANAAFTFPDANTAVEGLEFANTAPDSAPYVLLQNQPLFNDTNGISAVQGSDSVRIGGVGDGDGIEILDYQGTNTRIILPGDAVLNTPSWVLATDCTRAIWIGLCSEHTGPGHTPGTLAFNITSNCDNIPPGQNLISDQGGELLMYRDTTFYVGKRGNNVANPPALFVFQRGASGDDTRELVEGIENMQIRYGVDTIGNGAADVYVTADNVGGGQIVSVTIGLLLRSPNELLRGALDNRTYNVNGTKIVAPEDRHLRMVMNTTIGVRNRLR